MPASITTTRVTEIKPETKEVLRRHASEKKPRIAVYNPWGGALDEGWTRWLLDEYGFANKSVHSQDVKAGLANFDVLILPDVDKETIATGRQRRAEDAMKYEDELPPEYRGGLEKQGAESVRSFVENGGTLIAFNNSSDYVIQEFNIPVRNALARATDFSVPGSLVRIHVNTNHPVTQGMPSESAAMRPSCVCMPVANTAARASPDVHVAPLNTKSDASSGGVPPAGDAPSRATGTDSPVKADMSISTRPDSTRPSALTRPPSRITITSPGTRSRASMSCSRPSRTTVACGGR